MKKKNKLDKNELERAVKLMNQFREDNTNE